MRALAADLRAAGVETGHGVGLRMANGPDYIVAMMAIWLAGAVLIPINDRLPEAGLRGAPRRDEARSSSSSPTAIRPIGSPRSFGAGRRVRACGRRGRPGRPRRSCIPTARISSSSTGSSCRCAGGAQREGRAPSPNLIPVSLALNAGMYNALFGLRAGAPLVIMDRFTTAEFARLVHRLRHSLDRPATGRHRHAERRPRAW